MTGSAEAKLTVLGLTISDTRTPKSDGCRELARAFAVELGATRFDHEIVKDDADRIRAVVHDSLDRQIDVFVFMGGTGIAPRDVTVETIRPMLTKELDGFGELFRARSFDTIGSMSALSRALGGVIGQTLVFVLPGSPNAVRLALTEVVGPIALHAHAVTMGDRMRVARDHDGRDR